MLGGVRGQDGGTLQLPKEHLGWGEEGQGDTAAYWEPPGALTWGLRGAWGDRDTLGRAGGTPGVP